MSLGQPTVNGLSARKDADFKNTSVKESKTARRRTEKSEMT